jgi:Zn-dependent M28 family amino/carboxypeptidase
VVSGHYDSICTDPTNTVCDAPGADDDASGVIAVLEMARVMATRHFDATIVFMAVAGEEQGLYGSAYAAAQAKAAGTDVEGMLNNDIIGASRSTSTGISRPHVVRLFAEGVPTSETPAQAATRQSVGGENDSPGRQLARFVEEVAQNRDTGMDVQVIYRRGAIATCAAAITSRGSSRAIRRRASPSRTRPTSTSTRTCASRMACSSAISRSSSTSTP